MEIKNYITSGSSTRQFYQDCKNSTAVTDIFMAANLREARSNLFAAHDIHGFEGDSTAALNDLFQKSTTMSYLKNPWMPLSSAA